MTMNYVHTADPLFREKMCKAYDLMETYDESVSGRMFTVNTSIGRKDFMYAKSFYESLLYKISYLKGELPQNTSTYIMNLITSDLSRNPYSLQDLLLIKKSYDDLTLKMNKYERSLDRAIKKLWDSCNSIEAINSLELVIPD